MNTTGSAVTGDGVVNVDDLLAVILVWRVSTIRNVSGGHRAGADRRWNGQC